MIDKIFKFFKKIPIRSTLPIVGIMVVVLSAIFLLWHGNANSNQSIPAYTASVYFEGQYRIGDGEWQQIVENTIFY